MALAPGTRVGPYQVVGLIGSGGMGEVYRAHDPRLARDVAIKVLPAAFGGDPNRLRRFEQEARAAAALNHPHILTVFDVGSHDGGPYIVSELLEGSTLRESIPHEGFALTRALEYAAQLCSALAAAHDAGIVHRDLKPENIFVSRHSRVKVLDFGLAKLTEPAAGGDDTTADRARTTTIPGVILGTAGYLAPEQILGGAVDRRSDIFCLGVILHEMLAGVRPFRRDSSAEALKAALTADPPDLSDIRRDVPPALAKTVARCLAKDPVERFQDVRDLSFTLAIAASVASAARPTRDQRPPLEEGTFTLTQDVCRKLDRAALDPRMIGDRLHFLDNGVKSDVLVCFLHGLGLDQSEFETLMPGTPYRAMAPTLYGSEALRDDRLSLSITDHLTLLHEWLKWVVEREQPAHVVLVGHSAGADLAVRFPSAFDPAPLRIHGLVALDANINRDTCWITGVLAQTTADDPSRIVDSLRTVGGEFHSLHDWLNTHDYLVRVFRKFQPDFRPLTEFSREVMKPFATDGVDAFAAFFRRASAAVPRILLVFAGFSESNRRAIKKLKLANLDNAGLLGDRYREDTIVVERDADHFDLLEPSRLRPHLDALIASLEAPRL